MTHTEIRSNELKDPTFILSVSVLLFDNSLPQGLMNGNAVAEVTVGPAFFLTNNQAS